MTQEEGALAELAARATEIISGVLHDYCYSTRCPREIAEEAVGKIVALKTGGE